MYSKTCLTITSRWQNPNHQIFQKVRGFFCATGRSRRIWKELELLLEEDTERLTGLYKHAATMRYYLTFFLSKKHSSFVICSFQKGGGNSEYGWARSSNFTAVLIKKEEYSEQANSETNPFPASCPDSNQRTKHARERIWFPSRPPRFKLSTAAS